MDLHGMSQQHFHVSFEFIRQINSPNNMCYSFHPAASTFELVSEETFNEILFTKIQLGHDAFQQFVEDLVGDSVKFQMK